MSQLQVTNTTVNKVKKILVENKIHDGDYWKQMIEVFEKKTKVNR